MSDFLNKFLSLILMTSFLYISCTKDPDAPSNSSIPVPPYTDTNEGPDPSVGGVSCNYRPEVNATLVPVGRLSVGRRDLLAATAGGKILFAGGYSAEGGGYTPSTQVDIFDFQANTWSTAQLMGGIDRQGISVTSVGDKILFAGGDWPFDGSPYSWVDIYDASNNQWSSDELSQPRTLIAAGTLGKKAFFAGGGYNDPNNLNSWTNSDMVDIYDSETNTWSTDHLSSARASITATTAGNKLYFAGGTTGAYGTLAVSKVIDIFDADTHSWSTSDLHDPKHRMAGITSGEKIFWAGGYYSTYASGGWLPSNTVEIRDAASGVSSSACMIPRADLKAVSRDDNIVFFTGYGDDSRNGTHFEIYNTTTNSWFTGILDQRIMGAAIISVNNSIYVAGGSSNGLPPYFDLVWKLEF